MQGRLRQGRHDCQANVGITLPSRFTWLLVKEHFMKDSQISVDLEMKRGGEEGVILEMEDKQLSLLMSMPPNPGCNLNFSNVKKLSPTC